ncbi:MAG: site-specific integrase, partial [Candidatus Thalassarchaeaceae archaeon]|nr:site-specific integrase [Candidatus Thalassarchaeaceae archaeon]
AKGPRKSEYKCKALTAEQANALIDASSGWLRVAIIVGVKTGLRPGEVAALQWSDINFESGFLSVNHSSHSIRGGGVELRPPKTESSRRMVPIAADLESVLQDCRKTQAEIGISPFVITVEGRPLRRDTFTQAFGRLAKKSNIEATPHGLRHTFATALLEDGKPTAHVAELLGDSEATVANVYSHVLRPKVELREAIQAAIPINLP